MQQGVVFDQCLTELAIGVIGLPQPILGVVRVFGARMRQQEFAQGLYGLIVLGLLQQVQGLLVSGAGLGRV